jgi:adenylate kinase family enzyme
VVDVGQLARERSVTRDDIGEILRDAIARGVSAPPELIGQIMIERIEKIVRAGKFGVMAFSRLTEEYAVMLESTIPPDSTAVILFENLSEDDLVSRANVRCLDAKTGRPARISEKNPGAVRRIDDGAETIRKKFHAFSSEIGHGISAWKKHGYRIQRVDANGSENEVFDAIVRLMEEKT